MNRVKRVAAIHDLSCFGRCSLAVIMPVLSAMGLQCCPMPTAVMSTHTGGFDRIAQTGLTRQMEGTARHWAELGLDFDGIYTGYMASSEQIAWTEALLPRLKGENALVVVDPVLGDDGALYSTITKDMVAAMGRLCTCADVITPNLTEANLLLGLAPDSPVTDGEAVARVLSEGGRRSVVVTGVTPAEGLLGAAWFDRETGRTGIAAGPRVAESYPGTGDLFASVLTGGLLAGERLPAAVARSVDFVRFCGEHTLALGLTPRDGVEFEPLLGRLTKK